MNNEMKVNKLYYFGDVNPEHGGVVCRKLDNGSIEAWEIIEYSPISFCNAIIPLYVNDDYKTLDEIENAYYEQGFESDSYEGFFFMKATDREYTNESNLNVIDKFVRYDFNIWNLIRQVIGVKKSTKIHTYNGVM